MTNICHFELLTLGVVRFKGIDNGHRITGAMCFSSCDSDWFTHIILSSFAYGLKRSSFGSYLIMFSLPSTRC